MNITKLSIWPELQALGFVPINYNAHGRKVATGASLQREITSISGEKFKTDLITIEPTGSGHSDKRNYHIHGEVKTPFYDKFYQYKFGQKEEIYLQVTSINEYYKATDILPTIQRMLK